MSSSLPYSMQALSPSYRREQGQHITVVKLRRERAVHTAYKNKGYLLLRETKHLHDIAYFRSGGKFGGANIKPSLAEGGEKLYRNLHIGQENIIGVKETQRRAGRRCNNGAISVKMLFTTLLSTALGKERVYEGDASSESVMLLELVAILVSVVKDLKPV